MSLFVRLWRALTTLFPGRAAPVPARLRMSTPLGVRKLEERRVLNADLASTLLVPAPVDFGTTDTAPATTCQNAVQSPAVEVLFIDWRVADADQLAAGVRAGVEVHVVNRQSDGLTQVASALDGRTNLAAIHIVSHGESGTLLLGAGEITANSLSGFGDQLSAIGSTLSADGDLLVYGCNVGDGPSGFEFLQALSTLTGADVAASNDLTGAEFLGGDWSLEVEQGDVQAGIAFALQTQVDYAGVLASYQVDLATDENDGITSAGDVSLREAIGLANANAGADTITFATALNGTPVNLTLGQISISGDLTIAGNGTTNTIIDQTTATRIFNVTAANLTVDDVTLRDANITGNGGAINKTSFGLLAVSDSLLTGNIASGSGGAIWARGNINVTNSTISANSAAGAGALYAYLEGGRVLNITDSTISNNTGTGYFSNGGAIYANQVSPTPATVNITRSSLTGNSLTTGQGAGGAIQANANVSVIDSNISNNTARVSGGGISSFGNVAVVNSTFSGNRSVRGQSGSGAIQAASVTADNSTFASNQAGGQFGEAAAIEANSIVLRNSIVALNTTTNSFDPAVNREIRDIDGGGNITLTNSLLGRSDLTGLTPTGLTPDANGNLIGGTTVGTAIDPLLGPLQNNGGPTFTRALLTGSLAIDSGSNTTATAAGLTNDQRGAGFTRFRDGNFDTVVTVDMGAYEFYRPLEVDTTIDENDGNYAIGDLSLREAVALANTTVGTNEVTFATTLTGTPLVLSLGAIDITDSLVLTGLGSGSLTISGNDASRIFVVSNGLASVLDVQITGATLTNGRIAGAGNVGGAIVSLEDLTLTDVVVRDSHSDDDAGGIANAPSGTLTLIDSLVINNTAGDVGGGIGSNGTLTVLNSTLSNNTAQFGGGLFANGVSLFTESIVSGNQATGNVGSDGGGILNVSGGQLTFLNSTLSGNSAGDDGGGLVNGTGATSTFRGSTISGNTAGDFAGGIGNNGTLVVENSTVSGNSARSYGGGLQSYLGSLTLTNVTVTGNRSDSDGNGSGVGGGVFHEAATVAINNSIIASNFRGTGAAASDLAGVSTLSNSTNRFNLIGDANSANGLTDGSNGNLVGVSGVGVRPIATILNTTLAANGGPTLTHALIVGSAAINSGSNSLLPLDTFDDNDNASTTEAIPFDQRGTGFNRIFNGTVDRGAFESPIVVETTVARSGNVLTIADVGTASNDGLLIRVDPSDSTRLLISDASNTLDAGTGTTSVNSNTVAVLIADLLNGQIVVDSGAGDDLLTLDFTTAQFLTANGIVVTYNAGETGETNGDEIAITGGTIASLTYNVTSSEAGNFDVGGTSAGDIFFTQTEPATITSVLGTVTINIDDGVVGGTLATSITNNGNAADGILLLDLPGALEDMTFTAPTVALVINGDIDSDDVITIASLDTAYRAAITIDGRGATDTVNLNAILQLGDATAGNTGSLSVTGETINVNANVTTLAAGSVGDVTLLGTTITLGSSADLNTTAAADGDIAATASRNVTLEAGTSLATSNGDIVLTANIGGAAAGNFAGIDINQAQLTASGTGGITLNGTGGQAAGNNNYGVAIRGAGALVQVSLGDLEVTGQGGGTGSSGFNAGVAIGVSGAATIRSTNSGNVTITGTGGLGSAGGQDGVFVSGAGTLVSTVNGDLTINGFGGGAGGVAGDFNIGIDLAAGLTITSTGAGDIALNGTGGQGTGVQHDGIQIWQPSLTAPTISSTSTGKITLTGAAQNAVSAGSVGIRHLAGTVTTAAGTSQIEFVADSMILDDADANPTVISAGANQVTLRQRTAGQAINVGGADSGTQLGLTDAELDRITAGTLAVGNSSSGTITISDAVTRAAATHLSLTTGANQNIAFTSSGSLASNGGNVSLTTSGAGAITAAGGTTQIDAGAGSISLAAGSGGIGDTTNSLGVSTSNLSATTSGNANQFFKGTATIGVGGLNAGSGAIEFRGGTFTLGGSNRIADASAIQIAGGTGVFAIGAFSETVGGVALIDGSITGSTGTLTSISAFDVRSGSISAKLAGANGLTKSTAGTVTLSGTNTYAGTTAVNAGTLQLGASNVLADASTLSVDGGTFDINTRSDTVAGVALISGSITGTGTGLLTSTTAFDVRSGSVSARLGGSVGMTKSTSGTVTLSGANSFSGVTDVDAGTLVAASATALGTTAGDTVVDAGATLQIDGVAIGAEAVSLSGTLSGTGTASLTGGVTLTGTAILATSSAGDALTLTGALGGTGGFNKTGSGTLTLSSTASNFSGAIDLQQGTLRLGNSNVLPNTVDLNIAGGATLNLDGRSDIIDGLTGSGTVTNNHATTLGTLTVGGSNQATADFTGGIQNGATAQTALTKTGTGSQTLSNVNNYTGATNVNQGTLQIAATGSITSNTVVSGATLDVDGVITGTVIVNSGGVLSGTSTTPGVNGRVTSTVTVNTGGALSPGNSPGIINSGNLNLNAGSTFTVEVDDDNTSDPLMSPPGATAGIDYDQVQVTGTVSIGTTAVLNLADLGSTGFNARDVYTIISNDGSDAIVGDFGSVTGGVDVNGGDVNNGDLITLGGQTFRIFYNGGDGNDLVLINRPAVSEVFVSNATSLSGHDFTGLTPGTLIADVNFLLGGAQAGVYGIDAFATVQEGIDGVDVLGTVNVNTGTYLHDDSIDPDPEVAGIPDGLQANKAVTIDGQGMTVTNILESGAPGSNSDVAVSVTANSVTFTDVKLGWQVHNTTDYQGYVVYTNSDSTRIQRVLFGSNATGEGYRSAVVFEGTTGNGADNLMVLDSIFEGRWGRAAIRDGDGGSGENFNISRNEFREDHFRWGPIAIGPQDAAGTPNNFAYSGLVSFNYFGNGLDAVDFQSGGNQNYTVTFTNQGLTAAGLDILHNTFDWNDSNETNQNGIYAQPAGVFITPSLTLNTDQILIQDNIFNNFAYAGPQPGVESPDWRADGRVVGNGAMHFDGVGDFGVFQFPNQPQFDLGDSGSVTVWAQTDVGSKRHMIAGGALEMQIDASNRVYFYPGNLGSSGTLVQSTTTVGPLAWTHIAFTWENAGATQLGRIYVNGTEVSYGSGLDPNVAPNWTTFVNVINELTFVGRDPDNPGARDFQGSMDDLAFYNSALSASDVLNIYSTGAATVAHASMVALWEFTTDPGLDPDHISYDSINSTPLYLTTNGIVPFGPTWVAGDGVYGGSLDFDGQDDLATFRDPDFDVGSAGTLNFWAKLDPVTTSTQYQFFEGPGNSGLEMQFQGNSGGRLFGRTTTVGGDIVRRNNGDTTLLTSAGANDFWHNIQYTWDFATGQMWIYVDGTGTNLTDYAAGFRPNDLIWAAAVDTANGIMHMGYDPGSVGQHFGGLIDDVAWFDAVLTSGELATIRDTSLGMTGVAELMGDPRLLAHWAFDAAPTMDNEYLGDSGTAITLYLQQMPPDPPVSGYGVVTPLATQVLNNVFYNDVVGIYADSNQVLDPSNYVGPTANPFFNGDQPGFVDDGTLATFYRLRFGSAAAFLSTEIVGPPADPATLIPHIGANQEEPITVATEDILVAGSDFDDLLVVTFTGTDAGFFTLTRDVNGASPVFVGTIFFTAADSITFDGFDGDDVFIIYQPTAAQGGLYSLVNGITFNGGDQFGDGNALDSDGATGADTLVLLTSAMDQEIVDSAAYVFNDATPVTGHNGTITLTDDLGALFTVVTYTGTEPIRDELSVHERTFTYASTSLLGETINVSNPGDVVQMTAAVFMGDPIKPTVTSRTLNNLITSTLGPSVSFNTPVTQLNINAGVGNDTVNINSVHAAYRSALEINGDAGTDDVHFNTTLGTLTLGSGAVVGNLAVDAEAIDVHADVAIDATGGDVDGNVTFSNATTVTMNDTSTIAAGEGNVEMTASGNILVSRILSADTVCLTSTAASILDNRTTDEAANITAAAALLDAATGIGTGVAGDVNDIDTATVAGATEMLLAARTNTGDINLQHTGDLTVSTVKTLTGVVITDALNDNSAADDVSLVADGTLTTNAVVTNNDGGDIILRSTAAAVAINAAVSVTGNTGLIDIDAATSVALAGALSTPGGAVDIDAGTSVTNTVAGTITTTAVADSGVASGNVTIDAGLTAAGNIDLDGTVDTRGANNAGGTGSAGGAITLNANNVLGGTIDVVDLLAQGGMGSGVGGAGGAIAVTAEDAIQVTGTVNADGGDGGLAIGGVAGTVGITSTTGTIDAVDIFARGGSADDGAVGGTVTVTALGAVVITGIVSTDGGDGAAADGGAAGTVEVRSTGSTITVNNVNANGGHGAGGGGANNGGNGGLIILDNSAGAGDITLNGLLSAIGGTGTAAGAEGKVVLLTAGAIVDNDSVDALDVLAGSLQIEAQTGIAGSTGSNARLEIEVTSLAASTTTGNVVVLDDDSFAGTRLDGLTITTITTVVQLIPVATVGVSVTGDAGGRIDVEAVGPMTVEQQVNNAGDAATSTIQLSGLGIDLSLATADVTADGGNITIDANTGNLNMVAGSSIESDGANHAVTISTDSASLAAGASISSVGGTVAIAADTASRNINLGGGGAEPDTNANTFDPNALNLNDSELDVISAAFVNIGTASTAAPFSGATSGVITVTGGISATVNFATIEFQLLTSTDVAINSTVNLTANLVGDFDVIAGRDITQTNATADVFTAGDGFVRYTADRLIAMNTGTSITTVNGDVTLLANDGVSTTGDFTGITLTDADITTGTPGGGGQPGGDILLRGTGGDSNGNFGVLLQTGSTISSQGSGATAGTITVEGTGGTGAGGAVGVQINDSDLTTVDGNIAITGTGGGQAGGTGNRGVQILNTSTITSTGVGDFAAAITILGTSTAGMQDNEGVAIDNSTVSAVDGDISVTGDASGTTTGNNGVAITNGSLIESQGTGDSAGLITIDGTGGPGTNGNRGVSVVDSQVSSEDGDIDIAGRSNGTGTGNSGVFLFNSTVESTGTTANAATITIAGDGGPGSDDNHGVQLRTNSLVTSEVGNIQITGIALGTGERNIGVHLEASTVDSTGTATILIDGTGGPGTDFNAGVALELAAHVLGDTGNIDIVGRSNGTGSFNTGVQIFGASTVESSGTGVAAADITIDGTGGPGVDDNVGVWISDAGTLVTSQDGNILIDGTGGASSTAGGSRNYGVHIDDQAVVSSTGMTAAAATITILGQGGTAAAGTGGAENIGIRISDANTLVTSIVGNIEITGTAGAASNNAAGSTHSSGVEILNQAVVSSTGNGALDANVTIIGNGAAGVADNYGVLIDDANTVVSAVTGEVSITGTSGTGSGLNNTGVRVTDNAVVETTGAAGDIAIDGTGRGTGNEASGVNVDSSAQVRTVNGNVVIDGRSTASGTSAHGVILQTSADVSVGGGGLIDIEGTSTTNAAGSGNGVVITTDALVDKTGATGTISITGRDGVGANDAAVILNDAIVRSQTTQITITGVNQDVVMNQTDATNGVRSNSGNALIQSSNDVLLGIVNLDNDAAGAQGTAYITADADTNPAFTGGQDSDCVGEIRDNLTLAGLDAVNIVATAAVLRAGDGIGNFTYDGNIAAEDLNNVDQVNLDIDVEVTNLAALTCRGDIYVTDASAVNVVALDSLVNGLEIDPDVFALGGDILIRSSAAMTVNGHVVNAGPGSTTLAAGVAGGGSLTVNANITNGTAANGGDVRLVAFDGLTLLASSQIDTNGGDAELHAGRDFNFNQTLDLGAAGVDVTLSTGTLIATDGGDATITATDDVRLSRINTNNGAAVAGTTYAIADSDNSGIGAIVDNRTGEGSGNENITGQNASLRAAAGIGVADAIDTNVTNVAAVTDHGDIKIDDVSDLVVTTVVGRAFSLDLTTGSFGETNTGDVATLSGVTITDTNGFGADAQDSGVDFIGLQAQGSITVAAGNAVRNLDAGNITLDANAGGVTLNAAVDSRNDGGVFTGTVRVSAAGDVTQSAAGNVTAATLGVRTTSGQVNLLTAQNDVNVLAIATAGGDIGFRDADGFQLNLVGAQSNTMFDDSALFAVTSGLSAPGGSVRLMVNESDASPAGNDITQDGINGGITAANLGVLIRGGNVLLDPNGAVGPAINDVDVLSVFVRENGAGNGGSIEFSDSDDLTIGIVSGLDAFPGTVGLDATNNIILCSTGNLTLAQAVTTRASATIMANPTDIVRLHSDAGNVTQLATAPITTALLGVVAGGNIDLSSDDNDVDTLAAQAGGNIAFEDADDLTIGSVTATACFPGVVGLTADNLTLCVGGNLLVTQDITQAIPVTGDMRLHAGGNITQTATAQIFANRLGLRSDAGNITLTEANDVNFLAAQTFAAGRTITFVDADTLTIDFVSAAGCFDLAVTGVVTNNGAIAMTTGANLTIDDAGTTTAAVGRINAGSGSVTLTSGGAIVDGSRALSADGEVDVIGNAVTLTAQSGIGAGSGVLGDIFDLDLNATILTVTNVASGNVQLHEADSVRVATITNAGRLVVLDAVGQIIDHTPVAGDAAANVTAQSLALRAGTGIGNTIATPANDFDLAVTNLSASTADGDIHLSNSLDLNLTAVGGQAGVVNNGASDAISITGAGDINVLRPVTNAGNGSTLLDARDNINVDATITSEGGTITIRADEHVNFTVNGDVSSNNGDITVRADQDLTGGAGAGAIFMADVGGNSALINAGAGVVLMNATNDITLGGVTSTGGSGLVVGILSREGAIIDGGDTAVEITAENATGLVSLTAATGIGDGNPLETSVAVLIANVTATGDLEINEVSATGLELRTLTTNNGYVTVTSVGTILASFVDASFTGNNTNDITLTTTGTGADILVTLLRAGAPNDVLLSSSDDVLNSGAFSAASVVADDLIIRSFNNSADGPDAVRLTTAVQDLVVNVTGASQGNVTIANVGNLRLATADTAADSRTVSTSNGLISITTTAIGFISPGHLTLVDAAGGNDNADRTSDVELSAGGAFGGVVFSVAGDLNLETNAQIDAYSATLTPVPGTAPGSVRQGTVVTPNAPIVLATVQGDVQWGALAQVRTLQAGTGTVVGISRQITARPDMGPPPTDGTTAFYDASSVIAPPMTRVGQFFQAQLQVTIGQPGETSLSITIDWGTFEADRFETITGLVGGQTYTFIHDYSENEVLESRIRRSSSADPISVNFGVTMEGSVRMFGQTVTTSDGALTVEPDVLETGTDRGLDVVTSTDLIATVIPADPTTDGRFVENGLANFTLPSLELGLPQFNEEVELPVTEIQTIVTAPESIVTPPIVTTEREVQAIVQVLGREEFLELRVLSPDPDAAPLAVRRLPDEFLSGKEGASFTDLFNGLPDGTYEIWYVLGGNRHRLVRVDVRNGKAEVQQDELEGGKLKLEEVIDRLREQLSPADSVTRAPATVEADQPCSLVDVGEAQLNVGEALPDWLRLTSEWTSVATTISAEEAKSSTANAAGAATEAMSTPAIPGEDESTEVAADVPSVNAAAIVPLAALAGLAGSRRLLKGQATNPFSRSRRAARRLAVTAESAE